MRDYGADISLKDAALTETQINIPKAVEALFDDASCDLAEAIRRRIDQNEIERQSGLQQAGEP